MFDRSELAEAKGTWGTSSSFALWLLLCRFSTFESILTMRSGGDQLQGETAAETLARPDGARKGAICQQSSCSSPPFSGCRHRGPRSHQQSFYLAIGLADQ